MRRFLTAKSWIDSRRYGTENSLFATSRIAGDLLKNFELVWIRGRVDKVGRTDFCYLRHEIDDKISPTHQSDGTYGTENSLLATG